MALDLERIRQEFPILNTQINGKPLIYFDNAASSQKPERVINRLQYYYQTQHSNVHRGVHTLSRLATETFEIVRHKTAQWINARHDHEIIFTRGTTESINLVAYSFGKAFIQTGDEVLITTMEHHSNIVPWQMMCEERGAQLVVAPITDSGELDLTAFYRLLTSKTKIVSLCHISNTLGTINPLEIIIRKAHEVGAVVMVDGAQAMSHLRPDMLQLDADFYCFSSHKMYGPTGVGILYGKENLLNAMPPWQGGGEMIEHVSFNRTTYNALPFKFEAGTPNIADVIAFEAALDFVAEVGIDNILLHENALLAYATERLLSIPNVRIIGKAEHKAGVISFVVEGVHPFDLGTLLDQQGIAVRTGHHCTMPLMERFQIPGTTRISFGVYNTTNEVDAFIVSLQRSLHMLI